MSIPKANQRAVTKYIRNNYDEVKIRVYKGQRDIIQHTAEKRGMSVNSYVQYLIRNDIKQDGGDVSAWDALAPERDEQADK